MQVELTYLAAAAVLGLLHIVMAAVTANPQRGTPWNVGPRDEVKPPLTGVAGRLERAQANYFETFPIFAVAVLVAYLASKMGPLTQLGCVLYLAGRVIYIPLYAFGIPVVRTVAWTVATAGILCVLVAFFR